MTDAALSASPAIRAFEIDWREARRRARLEQAVGAGAILVLLLLSAWLGDFFKTVRVRGEDVWIVWAGLPRLGEYVWKLLPTLRWESLAADFAEWFWRWRVWLQLLVETILIACMATLLGFVGALVLSFPAARNLAPARWLHWVSRRYLEIARTVPELVWALIFVYCLGVGPLAGVLAIGLHATGALGKLYAEVNENADMRPVEGVRAAGGDWFAQMRYGVFPQVLPNILSYTLLRFEINVRSSSIIGFVGAGGLGQEIRIALSLQEYADISALFVIILFTVFAIDFGCEKLRHRVIGIGEATR
ncbi:MAG: phosphonate ABC transporter, permease protein PhnE [Rubrimonas sp.]